MLPCPACIFACLCPICPANVLRETEGDAKRKEHVDLSRFRQPRYLILIAALVAILAAPAGLYFANRTPPEPPMAFSDFLKEVEAGTVTQVTFDTGVLNVTFSNGRVIQTFAPPSFDACSSSFPTRRNFSER